LLSAMREYGSRRARSSEETTMMEDGKLQRYLDELDSYIYSLRYDVINRSSVRHRLRGALVQVIVLLSMSYRTIQAIRG
jgi:hypothetical protein